MAISSILGTILRLSSNIVFLLVFKWGIFGYLISLVIGPAVATVYAMIHIFPLKKDEILPKYEKNCIGKCENMQFLQCSVSWDGG